MLPSNVPPGSGLYQYVLTGQRAIAVRVSQSNRDQLAAWVRGQAWASGVVLPSPRGEQFVGAGAYLVDAGGRFEVWSESDFVQQWVLVVDEEDVRR